MSALQDPLQLDKQLCFAIYAAGHAFTRFYKPRLDALGITYPQYLVFLVLWEQDGLTVRALGQKLFLDSGTLTPLLKRLEALGYVTRRRDEEDERLVRIYLTGEGRALRDKALAVPLQVVGAAGMGVDAMIAMKMELDALRVRLEGAGE
ncbi:MAG TPA: MarR family transcriptional regulator [Arsenicitalea sp.]|nr:MarR family transcriptional regulator [Arsenicitalea sp.]